jgi:uncharacterized membrane protein
MITQIAFFLTLASALGCGLMAGVFFAFSTFVLSALARLPAAQGIAAMQSINVVVLNPVFLGVFVGTTVLSLGAVAASVSTGWKPAALWLIAGTVLYFLGNIVVTGACNVPRNDALALIDPASAEAQNFWKEYVVSWSAWNHVRTVTALAASAALTIGLWLSRTVATAP